MSNPTSSAFLQQYYAQQRAVIADEAAVRVALQALGVIRVRADYDGVGDSGQIDQVNFLDGSDPAKEIVIGETLTKRVDAILYALLHLRHGGWETEEGAYGTFDWNLTDGKIVNEHKTRFIDIETSIQEGFDFEEGDQP